MLLSPRSAGLTSKYPLPVERLPAPARCPLVNSLSPRTARVPRLRPCSGSAHTAHRVATETPRQLPLVRYRSNKFGGLARRTGHWPQRRKPDLPTYEFANPSSRKRARCGECAPSIARPSPATHRPAVYGVRHRSTIRPAHIRIGLPTVQAPVSIRARCRRVRGQ